MNRAERLKALGEIFLSLEPNAEVTGQALNIITFFKNDDMKLPVPIDQSGGLREIDRRNIELNEVAEKMPTSIQTRVNYSVLLSDDQVIQLIIYKQIVDLGYKIPFYYFPNLQTQEEKNEAAIQFLADIAMRRMNRTEKELQADQFEKAMRQTLLQMEQTTIILKLGLIVEGLMEVVHTNLMNGDTNSEIVNPDQKGLWFDLEFNLFSQLKTIMLKFKKDHPLKLKLQKLINDFCDNY